MLKLIICLTAAVAPLNRLRCGLLNLIRGYKIAADVYIGFGNFIYVESFKVDKGTKIGLFNVFRGPLRVGIGSKSIIGRFNTFICGKSTVSEASRGKNYARKLELGSGCLILHSHYFDVYGLIQIGDGTWIAGIKSQFWTHGVSVRDRDILIGQNNYIGSGVKFAPGSGIHDNNIVALGSVVLKRLEQSNYLISGFPAVGVKSILARQTAGGYRFSFEDWK
jgi:acetyltransferase-like isoleucine patch superfamily enzyme